MNATTTNEFLAKAKDIVNQHTELQQQVIMLQMQIGQLENTNMQAVRNFINIPGFLSLSASTVFLCLVIVCKV